MRTSFATVKPGAPLLDAIDLLLETNQRGLPVLDEAGTLVGIISEGDFVHRRELGVDYSEGFWLEWLLGRQEGQLARERMAGMRVETVMSRHPVCVDENATRCGKPSSCISAGAPSPRRARLRHSRALRRGRS
ncbi:CBS domain-containing protein [Bradyrhizobium sp. CCGUVB23]|uniref:CBS domain-containing protein n=1 Tax=Bradyrhizobium sp. CCGUVB23 TaxID=2949630 RepID=UPI0020B2AA77|nr:CBS domain-containing protein [Bradyrhizobium sp. CCGUVB23]MCP3463354.1 CBS domain-containing protein [Bradyrhizobium sp. CCGUVB23]